MSLMLLFLLTAMLMKLNSKLSANYEIFQQLVVQLQDVRATLETSGLPKG